MCGQVYDEVNVTTYSNARALLAAGVHVLQEDVDEMGQADADGLIRGYTNAVTGEPSEPFSPWDSCLCSVDVAAALDRTPGIAWKADPEYGDEIITSWSAGS